MEDPFSPERLAKPLPALRTEERRRSERHPFSAVADVTEPVSKAGVSVRIADLGLHGCYADSLTVFPVGTVVTLSLTRSGRHFETRAKVVYAKTGMGMGLHFQNLSPQMQSMLQEWLSLSAGEVAPLVEPSSVPRAEASAETSPPKEKLTLARLIELMMHKGQLTELEGRELLKQLQQDR